MKTQPTLLWGAALGGLAVAIGAFGAHALKPVLEATGRADTFELAVRYHFYHALALLASGAVSNYSETRFSKYARLCFLLGIFIFSGSLYTLSLSGLRMLGAITPIGGVFFILGWMFLFLGIYKNKKPPY